MTDNAIYDAVIASLVGAVRSQARTEQELTRVRELLADARSVAQDRLLERDQARHELVAVEQVVEELQDAVLELKVNAQSAYEAGAEGQKQYDHHTCTSSGDECAFCSAQPSPWPCGHVHTDATHRC